MAIRYSKPTAPQTLLIDADDTLWENNIYFERAIATFISFLNHQEFTTEQVREVLNDVERDCIRRLGYGLHSFAHALVQTFAHRVEGIPWILRTGTRWKNQLMPGEAKVARSQPYYGHVGAFTAQQLHVHRSSSATSARRLRPTCASRTTSCLTSSIAVMPPPKGGDARVSASVTIEGWQRMGS